jgi:valyl-tRNA synthetase
MNVAPGRKVQLTVVTEQKDIFTAGAPFFQRLAAATEVHVTGEAPAAQGQVEVVTHAARVFMPLAELVDVQQELERIAKEKAKAQGHLKGIEAKLNNEAFTSKAPEHIVQNQRDQAEKLKALIAQLEASESNLRSFS